MIKIKRLLLNSLLLLALTHTAAWGMKNPQPLGKALFNIQKDINQNKSFDKILQSPAFLSLKTESHKVDRTTYKDAVKVFNDLNAKAEEANRQNDLNAIFEDAGKGKYQPFLDELNKIRPIKEGAKAKPLPKSPLVKEVEKIKTQKDLAAFAKKQKINTLDDLENFKKRYERDIEINKNFKKIIKKLEKKLAIEEMLKREGAALPPMEDHIQGLIEAAETVEDLDKISKDYKKEIKASEYLKELLKDKIAETRPTKPAPAPTAPYAPLPPPLDMEKHIQGLFEAAETTEDLDKISKDYMKDIKASEKLKKIFKEKREEKAIEEEKAIAEMLKQEGEVFEKEAPLPPPPAPSAPLPPPLPGTIDQPSTPPAPPTPTVPPTKAAPKTTPPTVTQPAKTKTAVDLLKEAMKKRRGKISGEGLLDQLPDVEGIDENIQVKLAPIYLSLGFNLKDDAEAIEEKIHVFEVLKERMVKAVKERRLQSNTKETAFKNIDAKIAQLRVKLEEAKKQEAEFNSK